MPPKTLVRIPPNRTLCPVKGHCSLQVRKSPLKHIYRLVTFYWLSQHHLLSRLGQFPAFPCHPWSRLPAVARSLCLPFRSLAPVTLG